MLPQEIIRRKRDREILSEAEIGAFVAGLRAGRLYNTWPLMDGRFIPEAYFKGAPRLGDLFESFAAVQFNHRLGAYLLAAGAAWFYLSARKTALERRARLAFAAIGLQIGLGVWTLLAATPIALGLLHQAGALAVLAAAAPTLALRLLLRDLGHRDLVAVHLRLAPLLGTASLALGAIPATILARRELVGDLREHLALREERDLVLVALHLGARLHDDAAVVLLLERHQLCNP